MEKHRKTVAFSTTVLRCEHVAEKADLTDIRKAIIHRRIFGLLLCRNVYD